MAKGGEFGLGRARKEWAEDIRMIRGTMVMNYVLNIHGMQIAYRVPPMSTRIALQDTPEWRGAGETSAHRSSSHWSSDCACNRTLSFSTAWVLQILQLIYYNLSQELPKKSSVPSDRRMTAGRKPTSPWPRNCTLLCSALPNDANHGRWDSGMGEKGLAVSLRLLLHLAPIEILLTTRWHTSGRSWYCH